MAVSGQLNALVTLPVGKELLVQYEIESNQELSLLPPAMLLIAKLCQFSNVSFITYIHYLTKENPGNTLIKPR
jgi:hypothetical protein